MIQSAIGRSTELISPDSNIIIIIVRKGSRPMRTQMVDAIGLVSETPGMRPTDPLSFPGPEEPIHLQRINTVISSIVGADNGNRVGGLTRTL